MKNIKIIALMFIFSATFAAEYLTRMDKLQASKNQLDRGVELVQREYESALNDKDFDIELLKQIKQLLFNKMDELNTIKKKILEEYTKNKAASRAKTLDKKRNKKSDSKH